MTSDGIVIRPITSEEVPAFYSGFMRTMGFGPPSESDIDRFRRFNLLERTVAAVDGDQIVGSAYSHLFEMTLPGSVQLPVAGVTAVSVATTHRRRGILTRLMERQLGDARDRGEVMAVLIASESLIYGRFGYGLATTLIDVEIDTRDAALRPDAPLTGRVTTVDEATADKLFPEVYERHRVEQPGAVPRNEAWWEQWRETRKPGQEFVVIHEDDQGRVDGYCRYTIRAKWADGLPNHSLDVSDFVTHSVGASAALWRHMMSADLVRKVNAGARPIDEPLRWLLANPRAMRVTRMGDLLWTRVLDISRALAARRYATDDEIVIGVTDALFSDQSGSYRLVASSGAATCDRTEASPDVSMSVAELGAVFLGGTSPGELASVGRIDEQRRGGVQRLEACFASRPKPWSATWF